MADTMTKPVLVADVAGMGPGDVAYVHDTALDGDEDLYVGKDVLIDPGYGDPLVAKVVKRDEKTRMWFMRLAISE